MNLANLLTPTGKAVKWVTAANLRQIGRQVQQSSLYAKPLLYTELALSFVSRVWANINLLQAAFPLHENQKDLEERLASAGIAILSYAVSYATQRWMQNTVVKENKHPLSASNSYHSQSSSQI